MPECLALPGPKRAALIDSSRLLQIAAGEGLPDGGDVACLLSGRLAVLKPMPDGRGHIVGLPGAGAVLGWSAGAGNGTAADGYDITALEPCDLALLDPGLFRDLLQHLPDLEQRLIGQVLDEAEAARDWLRLLAQPKVAARLAGFLMLLGRELASADGVLRIPFRRADLASYLGTRKETLSRAFHQLEAGGAIRILDPATVQTLQPALLQDIAGLDTEEPPAAIGRP
jgi:CRP/FNR family transcriptional regulator